MTEDQLLVWCAGFFDGEGCVQVGCHLRKNTYQYQLRVSVVQSNCAPLEVFLSKFGGSIVHNRKDKAYDIRNPSVTWAWTCGGPVAKAFLTTIYPFVVAKKDEVGIAIEYPVLEKIGRPNASEVYPGLAAKREEIRNLLQAAKRSKRTPVVQLAA